MKKEYDAAGLRQMGWHPLFFCVGVSHHTSNKFASIVFFQGLYFLFQHYRFEMSPTMQVAKFSSAVADLACAGRLHSVPNNMCHGWLVLDR